MLTVVPISALQHYMYCPRQCALIHVECLWSNNQATAQGNVFHERADSGTATQRGEKRIVRSLHLQSPTLGISGIADIVEITRAPGKGAILSATPIEYKAGRPKQHSSDEVQLCAQALCLEETFGITIGQGFLFYGKTKRQHAVVLDDSLRNLTKTVIRKTRALIDAAGTPPARDDASCKLCSLYDLCMPRLARRKGNGSLVARLFEEALSEHGEELL